MIQINYSAINKALEKEFGKGQVELRPSYDSGEWDYVLRFLDEHAPLEVMTRAREIVDQFEPTNWLEDKMYFTEE